MIIAGKDHWYVPGELPLDRSVAFGLGSPGVVTTSNKTSVVIRVGIPVQLKGTILQDVNVGRLDHMLSNT